MFDQLREYFGFGGSDDDDINAAIEHIYNEASDISTFAADCAEVGIPVEQVIAWMEANLSWDGEE